MQPSAHSNVLAPTVVAALTLLSPQALTQGVHVDWQPTANVTLNTDVGRILTNSGWFTVRGGVYVFRNVTIPANVTVRGEGTKPLIFVVAGRITIDGTISVEGGDGQRVDTLNSANFPALGGRGHCGGGDGGLGSPYRTQRSVVGGWGNGPLQIAGLGGAGGRLNCQSACGIASGGGGGAFATQGDPWYKAKPTIDFVQPLGQGAWGCRSRVSRTLPGGDPGPLYFRDRIPGNNHFGLGVDVFRRQLVPGELTILVGGSGGGGGGDHSTSCVVRDPNFNNDDKGGGGGAGGGVFAIVAGGVIKLGPTARVTADGGDGGGGAWAGSNNRGAGGGGGAGGFLALYSESSIDIEVQGETYANNDYRFPVSADGGVGLGDTYGSGSGLVRSKYDPAPHIGNQEARMNARPTGGMGGMGLIQFMVKPGRNADGTNTLLDDNVILRKNGVVLRGAEKQRYLAWRGFPDANGISRDDSGNIVNIGDKAGDFRPCPVLLPVF